MTLVINPVKIVNQLEHQRRTWETHHHRAGVPSPAKIKRLGREIKALASIFGLKPDGGGYYTEGY